MGYGANFGLNSGRVRRFSFIGRQDGERRWDVECACHGLCLHVHVHSISNDKYDRGKDIYRLFLSSFHG